MAWMDVAIFAGVVVIALGLRLLYVFQLRHSPMFAHPIMDELYHDQWAQAIVAGDRFVEGPYFRAPLYPWLLGAIYRVFGHGYLAPRLIQSVIGALSCGVLYLIGRRVFGRRIGLIAGLAAATYWMLIYYDGELLIPTLIVFLDLLLIWQLFRASSRPSMPAYGLAGLLLGVSALARPNILLFAPAVVVWLVLAHRPAWRKAGLYVAALTTGCLVAVLPVTIRNYVVGGDVVLIASQGGVNFYIGNNPQSDGMTAIVPGTPGDWWGGYYATIARAEQAAGRKLRPSEVSQYYFGESWNWIKESPADFIALTLRKLRYFWSRWEIPNNKSIYFWSERFTPMVRWLPLGFAVVGTLGLVGLALSLRRAKELFPLWGFVLVYMVSVVMFFCTARYRTPVLAPLILLGVWGVLELVRLMRRDTRWAAAGVALLVSAGMLVNTGVRPGGDALPALSYKSLAQAYTKAGELEDAESAYRESLRFDPALLISRYNLATTLASLGRHEEAVKEFRIAVETPPRERMGEGIEIVAAAHNGLGVSLNEIGKQDEAIEQFRQAMEMKAGDTASNAQANLIALLSNRVLELAGVRKFEEAAETCREIVALQPDNPTVLRNLGRVYVELGRDDEAIEVLEHALKLVPNDAVTRTVLSDAYSRLGHYAAAVRVLREGLEAGELVLVNQLAWLLATCPDGRFRNGEEAARLARTLCPADANCHPAMLDTLAAAQAEAGRFNEAVNTARRALDAARTADYPGHDELVEEIASRLKLYESGKPFHQANE